jgi:hypothetical protein
VRSVSALLVLAGAATSSDAWADECADRFFPDRPGATNGHWTAAPGCSITEIGTAVERTSDATTVTFPLLFRVGLADVVELRGTTGLIAIEAPDEGDTTAAGTDAALQVKVTGHRADGQVPGVGALFSIGSVANSQFADSFTASASLLFDWQLFDGFWLAANAIATAPPKSSPPHVLNLGYATVVWYDLLDWMSVYGNAFGSGPIQDGDFSQWAGGGLAFYPHDVVQIDVTADAEATGDVHPVLMQAGVALGF